MRELELHSDDGRHAVRILMPPPDSQRSVLAIACPKAGSVMLAGILRSLCRSGGRTYLGLQTALFMRGYDPLAFQKSIAQCLHGSGYVYLFRNALDCFNDRIGEMTSLFLIRDPRDCVVSLYFSLKHSHFIPAGGPLEQIYIDARHTFERTAIDDAILNGSFDYYFERLERIFDLSRTKAATVYRYEDVIFSKESWIRDLASRLAVELDDTTLARLLRQFDVRPKNEDISKHIRRVSPGDYKNKLGSRSVQYLEDRYRRLFEAWGYARASD